MTLTTQNSGFEFALEVARLSPASKIALAEKLRAEADAPPIRAMADAIERWGKQEAAWVAP